MSVDSLLRLATSVLRFRAKNGGKFSLQSIGNIRVVCPVAMQDAKSFLFPAFSLNCDDGAAHFRLTLKDARDHLCCTCFFRLGSLLISGAVFVRHTCAAH